MSIWANISSIGISKGLNNIDKKIVVLSNRLIYFSLICNLIFIPLLYVLKIYKVIYPSVILATFTVSLFILAKYKKHQLALFLLFCMQLTSIMVFVSYAELMSPLYLGGIMQMFLIPTMMLVVVLMKNSRHSFLLTLLIICFYGIIEIIKYYSNYPIIDITQQYLIIYVFTVFVIFGSLFYYIIQFKQIDEVYTSEIINKKTHIEEQLHKLNRAHLELQNSIEYAKKIQTYVLASDKIVSDFFDESFLFFRPKDIVAGDFYWCNKTEEYIYFAVADCTGHGVPGALVSLMCNNALNRALGEYKLTETGEILDKTRDIITTKFDKSDDNVKDGMDIALIRLPLSVENEDKTYLQFSGAFNPLWIIRENNLIEISACRQPIGNYYNQTPFVTQKIEVFKKDQLYIFSDGFADQFGGEKGKKYKKKPFKKLLLDYHLFTMQEQCSLLLETFDNWKKDTEQVDDVCIVGYKL